MSGSPLSPRQHELLLELAGSAARLAGKELSSRFGHAVQTRMKGVDDPVTEADLAAAKVLEELLLDSEVPDWLCEESKAVPTRPTFWAVDPMDGTRSFLEGERDFTVSVGLIEAGRPVLGVIYNPMTGECFSALRGGGLWVEGAGRTAGRRRVLDSVPLARCALVTSRTELRKAQLGGLETAVGSVLPCGSIAYKMARVAAGDAHATISRTPKSLWDIAAGTLFLEEAGASVTDLWGRPLDGRVEGCSGLVAAAPELHAELIAWLVSHQLQSTV